MFRGLAARADPGCWQQALGLVRGRVFAGLCLGDWAIFDGTQSEVEELVVATALKGAAHAIACGSGDDAEWMIRRGLRVRPYDERLYRGLLRAVEARGDRCSLRSTMAELLRVATGGSRPAVSPGARHTSEPAYAPLHPRTVALYRQLEVGRAPASGGHPARL